MSRNHMERRRMRNPNPWTRELHHAALNLSNLRLIFSRYTAGFKTAFTEIYNYYSNYDYSVLVPSFTQEDEESLIHGLTAKLESNLAIIRGNGIKSDSAGKSFVAEILMLRRIMSTGKMAILVLPYVSICAEKAEHLELLLEPLGRHVRSYYGNQGGGSLPKDTSVAVCTIEKANSLVNRLLEEGRLSELGIIVIDELHMGSAADIIKLAMINIHSVITGEGDHEGIGSKFSNLRGNCRIILQVHDELVLEAEPRLVAEAAKLVQISMESAASLLVPLRVKLMVGQTWGSLEPFRPQI